MQITYYLLVIASGAWGPFLAIYSASDSRPMLLLQVIGPSILVKKVYKRSGDTIIANLTLLPVPVFSLQDHLKLKIKKKKKLMEVSQSELFFVHIENLNQQSIWKEKFEFEACRSLCESFNCSFLWRDFGFSEGFISKYLQFQHSYNFFIILLLFANDLKMACFDQRIQFPIN